MKLIMMYETQNLKILSSFLHILLSFFPTSFTFLFPFFLLLVGIYRVPILVGTILVTI